MIGRLKDLTFGREGEQHITVTVQSDFRERFDELRDFDINIEIKRHRNKRSLSANAYFHVLAGKIAERQGLGNDEVKTSLVCEYGSPARDTTDGSVVGFKLPASVDANLIYPYVKQFDTRTEDGRVFNCYIVYKQTHLMDSAEMGRLIDGAIYVAKDIGIETDTPEQIAHYKQLWQFCGKGESLE
jgi:hypothetical protein